MKALRTIQLISLPQLLRWCCIRNGFKWPLTGLCPVVAPLQKELAFCAREPMVECCLLVCVAENRCWCTPVPTAGASDPLRRNRCGGKGNQKKVFLSHHLTITSTHEKDLHFHPGSIRLPVISGPGCYCTQRPDPVIGCTGCSLRFIG